MKYKFNFYDILLVISKSERKIKLRNRIDFLYKKLIYHFGTYLILFLGQTDL